MADIIVHIQKNGNQAREKSGTYGKTGFHAHGKEQNKNPLLFGFPSATEPTGLISARELAIDLAPKPTL